MNSAVLSMRTAMRACYARDIRPAVNIVLLFVVLCFNFNSRIINTSRCFFYRSFEVRTHHISLSNRGLTCGKVVRLSPH